MLPPSSSAGGVESRIAESLPFDVATLELAIEQYLDQVDELGVGVARALAGSELYYWLAAVALGITAGEMARRRLRRPRSGPVLTETGGDTRSDWFLGLSTQEA